MTDSSLSASPSSLKIYFRLLGYVRPYISLFLISIVGFLIFASTQPMLGYILKYFVDGLSNPEAALFPTVPYLRDLQLLQAVPLTTPSAMMKYPWEAISPMAAWFE